MDKFIKVVGAILGILIILLAIALVAAGIVIGIHFLGKVW